MKKVFILTILSCLLLSSCTDSDIGIIGGADGPTSIYVKGQFGEQYEKKPVRMFNIDGELYYDSGLVSETDTRCGVMDGSVKKTVAEGEVPLKSGEANFDADGYQHATNITKEVCIDGEWVIFKKFKSEISNGNGEVKYGFYIKGHLNNAAIDSELIVLTDNKDITFSQVYEPMLSSQFDAGKDNGIVVFDHVTSGDKWGLTLYAEDVTNKGMTIKYEQFGGNPTGELETGAWYKIEKIVDENWQDVETKVDDVAWNMIAYMIKKNDITEYEINWEFLYGELPAGEYRLSKKIADFRVAESYDEEIYYAYFTIK
ncbi:MAG: hypothetical protein IJ304_00445 [Clostridia bacterium]|nr:hypothetical protein [Clostridia bacterium]